MIDCCCGNTEGTNKECERCRLIARIERLERLPTAITSANAESKIREAIHVIIHNWSEWDADAGQIAQQEQDPEAYDAAMTDHIGCVLAGMVFDVDPDSFDDGTVYVSPGDQKLNDAIERGDELRDRSKDEKQ